ncbi:MAG: lamin tail domain-containing protein [Acidobacteria bacterium]|nr:lamin tail domain-containing protein [Acidobacteriota bacterium]
MKARSIFGSLFAAAAVFAVCAAVPSIVSAQKAKRVKFDITRPDAAMVSTTITISQVYGGGGGATGVYNNDYVELRNISATAQSLNGLSLYYGSATGQFASTATNAFALPNVTLQPGQYFLVQTGGAGAGGVPVPNPDATTTNLSMSGASGKVALVVAANFPINTCGATATPCPLPDPNIIDLISYGVSNNGEGGTLANNGVALASTQGVIRKLGGCRDTDNNNNDTYIVTNPIPKNTASGYTRCGQAQKPNVDFDGDRLTDFALVRPGPGGLGGQLTFYNRTNETFIDTVQPWGLNSDFVTPGDFDGDGRADYTVWRQAAGRNSGFYILRSSDATAQFIAFGQAGDDPFIVRDYDGDGKSDPAIYRQGSNPTDPSTFWYFSSLNQVQTAVSWGLGSDSAVPGDYDGDGKADFGVIRDIGAGQMVFIALLSGSGTAQYVSWGLATDNFVPGDYDGDGRTDLAVTRNNGGNILWIIRPSSGAPVIWANWGVFGTDYEVQGDYDGDGRTDIGIWRPSTTPNASAFFFLRSTGGFGFKDWGTSEDIPTGYDVH